MQMYIIIECFDNFCFDHNYACDYTNNIIIECRFVACITVLNAIFVNSILVKLFQYYWQIMLKINKQLIITKNTYDLPTFYFCRKNT